VAVGEPVDEGWWMPATATRWHYFRAGRALCRRWGTFTRHQWEPVNMDLPPGPDDCKPCWSARKKELARG